MAKTFERGPCRKCGGVDRYESSGACKTCAVARAAKRYEKNADSIKAYARARYEAAPAAFVAAAKDWKQRNPEQARAHSRAWNAAHPEVGRRASNNRRARVKAGATGGLSKGIVQKLYDLQRGKCACCKKPLGDDYHLDHRMPLARGGKHEDENMQLLRGLCNRQKAAKDPVDFMQERGFLL